MKTLIQTAQAATQKAYPLSAQRKDWEYLGHVGAAIESSSGWVYTGVNLALLSGIGFCAEHSAAAAMIQAGETRIKTMVAVTHDGKVLPPYRRYRELIYQSDKGELAAKVIIDEARNTVLLRELLSAIWQQQIEIYYLNKNTKS